jgi:hypothetical protein
MPLLKAIGRDSQWLMPLVRLPTAGRAGGECQLPTKPGLKPKRATKPGTKLSKRAGCEPRNGWCRKAMSWRCLPRAREAFAQLDRVVVVVVVGVVVVGKHSRLDVALNGQPELSFTH